MYQIVYISKANVAPSDTDLAETLTQFRAFNHSQAITGLLLFTGSYYFQVLEGDEGTIAPLYTKICDDARHHNVQIVDRGPINERAFANWAMGYGEITEASLAPLRAQLAEDKQHDGNHRAGVVQETAALIRQFMADYSADASNSDFVIP
uniref:BLUF domain-containing protein n=1 Tax=Thaumasiovibrio occultus TaxID=1891184 RepID=UPI000B360A96|nr:BLUF domain-containing protein [Thaumasiovibrio occultus]